MDKNKVDVFSKMTDKMKEVLEIQEDLSKNCFSTENGFDQMRKNYIKERSYWNEGGPIMDKIVNNTIEGPYGEIPIRLYYPKKDFNNSPAIFIHGGGFVVGNIDTHDRIMRNFAYYSNRVVIGIDYKLSPEYKFPVALKECAAVASYIHENGEAYELDGNKIILMGDSGGANLSLATALYLRDELKDNRFIKGLLLYYGGFGLKDSASMRILGGPWDGLERKDLEYYYNCYLEKEKDRRSPYFDCLSSDLGYSMPPVYLAAGDLDPLLDDTLVLYRILKEKNIPCKCDIYKGLLHSFLHYSKILEESQDALKNGADFLENILK